MLDKIIDLGISRVEAEELINISENIEKKDILFNT